MRADKADIFVRKDGKMYRYKTVHEVEYIDLYATIKKFDDDLFKVTVLKTLARGSKKYSKKNSVNDEKLDCNLSRSRNKIYELAYCNDWEYYCTLTLDKKKYNRYDLNKFHKDLGIFIRNVNYKSQNKMKYLLIPEMHKNGAWHMHGFFKDIDKDKLRLFTLNDKIPERIRIRIKQGYEVYTWKEYEDKFGYSVFEKIEYKDRIAKYVTKYINKQMMNTVKEAGAHTYYRSRGLREANIIEKGILAKELENIEYMNEYCAIAYFDSLEKAKEYIKESEIIK